MIALSWIADSFFDPMEIAFWVIYIDLPFDLLKIGKENKEKARMEIILNVLNKFICKSI